MGTGVLPSDALRHLNVPDMKKRINGCLRFLLPLTSVNSFLMSGTLRCRNYCGTLDFRAGKILSLSFFPQFVRGLIRPARSCKERSYPDG